MALCFTEAEPSQSLFVGHILLIADTVKARLDLGLNLPPPVCPTVWTGHAQA